MNEKLRRLERWGCDVQGAMPRFLRDEEFMVECILQVSQDPAFESLGRYLEEQEIQKAFEAAHMLKEIIANTGLTPMDKTIERIVEPLRRGSAEGLKPWYDALIKEREQLSVLVSDVPNETAE